MNLYLWLFIILQGFQSFNNNAQQCKTMPNSANQWFQSFNCNFKLSNLEYEFFQWFSVERVCIDSMTIPLPNTEDIAIWLLFQCFQCFLKFIFSCTIKPVLGVTIKAIAKLSVCLLQNCGDIGVRVNSPPQHLTTPLSEIACNSSLLYRSSARINTHEHCCRPLR